MILGKTNLSEWANFRSSRSTLGLERARRADQQSVRARPHRLRLQFRQRQRRSPPAWPRSAIGTETDGSIICPSSVAGLVGIKPTVGLVSRSGIIPISHSQDTAGPMARSVADAAVLLSAIVGRDEGDAATAESSGRAMFDYHARLNADGLRGARIGVLRKAMGFHSGRRRRDGAQPSERCARPARKSSTSRSPAPGSGTTPNSTCCCTSSRHGLERLPLAQRRAGAPRWPG